MHRIVALSIVLAASRNCLPKRHSGKLFPAPTAPCVECPTCYASPQNRAMFSTPLLRYQPPMCGPSAPGRIKGQLGDRGPRSEIKA
jgi:hypothetical protein